MGVIYLARNQEQNEKMREERQSMIRAEALRQFAAKGLSATKIKDIAEGVGMAQGLIYHYYPSKEDIYLELINHALDNMNEAVFNLAGMTEPPNVKIKLAISEMLKTIDASQDFNQTCRLIAGATNSSVLPPSAQEIIERKRDIPYQEVARIMEAGQADGSVIAADPYELAVIFWTAVNGLAIYKATRPDPIAMPPARIIYNMFLIDQDKD